MKNLSGNADYATPQELSRKKKISKNENGIETPMTLNKEGIRDFIDKFNDLYSQCEKLYETHSLKQLNDILASFYSVKNDIKKLTDFVNN